MLLDKDVQAQAEPPPVAYESPPSKLAWQPQLGDCRPFLVSKSFTGCCCCCYYNSLTESVLKHFSSQKNRRPGQSKQRLKG